MKRPKIESLYKSLESKLEYPAEAEDAGGGSGAENDSSESDEEEEEEDPEDLLDEHFAAMEDAFGPAYKRRRWGYY